MGDEDVIRSALASSEAWLRRWAVHAGSCNGGSGCTCGLTAVQRDAAHGLEVADYGLDTAPDLCV